MTCWLLCSRPHPHPQIADLEASINAVPCDAVVIATPMDLRKLINIKLPATAVRLGKGAGGGAAVGRSAAGSIA